MDFVCLIFNRKNPLGVTKVICQQTRKIKMNTNQNFLHCALIFEGTSYKNL